MAKEGELRECPKCHERTMVWTHIKGPDPASLARGDSPPDIVSVDQAWVCSDCGHRIDAGIKLQGADAWPASE